MSDSRAFHPAFIAILGLGMVAVGIYLLVLGRYNWLAAVIVFGSITAAFIVDKRASFILTFAYLLLLGDLRRIGSFLYGSPKPDLLILEGAAVSFVLGLPLLLRIRLNSAVTKTVFTLAVIMALEIFNPRQGGIGAGLAGALMFLVPVLWFWIGRRYGSPSVVPTILYGVVVPIAFAAACLGLYQTFVGLLPWEQAWVSKLQAIGAYHALNVGGHVRAFGFSVSASEYAGLLGIGSAACLGAFWGGKRVYGLLLLLLVPMLILSSVRGVLVKLIISVAMMWALRAGKNKAWIPRFIAVLALSIAGVVYLATQVSTARNAENTTAAQGAVAHEAELFTHPLDRKRSTLGAHSGYLLGGIAGGFTGPIGFGLGAGSLGAAPSSAQERVAVTETDFGDMFVTCGFAGGLLYIYFMFLVVRTLIRRVRLTPSAANLSLAGVLIASMGSWLGNSGGYCIPPVLLFLIGSLEFPGG